MNLSRVFLSHNVIVQVESDRQTRGESCFVHSVGERELVLVAADEGWRSRPPETGDAIVIKSNRMEATYAVEARVTACKRRTGDTGERMLRIHAETTGEVSRIQRRDNFRVKMELRVEMSAPREGIITPMVLTTHDVSAGGLRLESPQPLDLGSDLSLILHLPGDPTPVRCGGEVVRCEPAEADAYELSIALKRVRISDEDRIVQALTKVIRDTLRAMREQE